MPPAAEGCAESEVKKRSRAARRTSSRRPCSSAAKRAAFTRFRTPHPRSGFENACPSPCSMKNDSATDVSNPARRSMMSPVDGFTNEQHRQGLFSSCLLAAWLTLANLGPHVLALARQIDGSQADDAGSILPAGAETARDGTVAQHTERAADDLPYLRPVIVGLRVRERMQDRQSLATGPASADRTSAWRRRTLVGRFPDGCHTPLSCSAHDELPIRDQLGRRSSERVSRSPTTSPRNALTAVGSTRSSRSGQGALQVLYERLGDTKQEPLPLLGEWLGKRMFDFGPPLRPGPRLGSNHAHTHPELRSWPP
jgi:hypothetical protein